MNTVGTRSRLGLSITAQRSAGGLASRPRAAYGIGSKDLLHAVQASESCRQGKLRCEDADGAGQHILLERVPDA